MQTTGKVSDIKISYESGKPVISFEIDAKAEDLNKYLGIDLDISFDKHRNHRSNDANRLLWECLGRVAAETGRDKWTEYLSLLKDYGKYTYVVVKPGVVEAMKKQWRETEVIGEIDINGTKGVQMLCYFGSSTYNTKEFSVLLDGLMDNMRDLGLDIPPTGDLKRALEQWEKTHG